MEQPHKIKVDETLGVLSAGLFSFPFFVHFQRKVGAGMPLLRVQGGMSVRAYRRIK